jgi:CHASE2 domain-containing sensor protein
MPYKTKKLRAVTIAIVVALSIWACYSMASTERWGELITAILGVAGFILTWDVTSQKWEDEKHD